MQRGWGRGITQEELKPTSGLHKHLHMCVPHTLLSAHTLTNTIHTHIQGFVVVLSWLNISEPGNCREAVEDHLQLQTKFTSFIKKRDVALR